MCYGYLDTGFPRLWLPIKTQPNNLTSWIYLLCWNSCHSVVHFLDKNKDLPMTLFIYFDGRNVQMFQGKAILTFVAVIDPCRNAVTSSKIAFMMFLNWDLVSEFCLFVYHLKKYLKWEGGIMLSFICGCQIGVWDIVLEVCFLI